MLELVFKISENLFFDAEKTFKENMQTSVEDVVERAFNITLGLVTSAEHIQIFSVQEDVSTDSTPFVISTLSDLENKGDQSRQLQLPSGIHSVQTLKKARENGYSYARRAYNKGLIMQLDKAEYPQPMPESVKRAKIMSEVP